MAPRNSHVQSVARALDLLETLADAPDGIGVSELARALDLKTPTAHNLLRTLSGRRYVSQDQATRKYRLSVACGGLGRAFRRNLRVPQLAQPHLTALSAEINESVVLGMLERGAMAFVARTESDQVLTVNFRHAWVPDAYASVCGRVLLSHLADDALAAFMASHPPHRSRAEDIRSKKDLLAVVAGVKSKGYCAYWRDKRTVFATAAPVFDAEDRAVAAVGVSMPGVRVRDDSEPHLVEAVCRTAQQISEELGWRPPAEELPPTP